MPKKKKNPSGMKQGGLNLPQSQWNLLKAVAFKRAHEEGQRISVSAIVSSLIEEASPRLEEEAKRYL